MNFYQWLAGCLRIEHSMSFNLSLHLHSYFPQSLFYPSLCLFLYLSYHPEPGGVEPEALFRAPWIFINDWMSLYWTSRVILLSHHCHIYFSHLFLSDPVPPSTSLGLLCRWAWGVKLKGGHLIICSNTRSSVRRLHQGSRVSMVSPTIVHCTRTHSVFSLSAVQVNLLALFNPGRACFLLCLCRHLFLTPCSMHVLIS